MPTVASFNGQSIFGVVFSMATQENPRGEQLNAFPGVNGREALDRYEAALARLRPEDREAIVGRVEMDCSYEELAAALGKPTADAARKAARRALLRLAEEMKRV